MYKFSGKEFVGILTHVLKYPLLFDEKDLENASNAVNVLLPIRCYDPDEKAKQEHLNEVYKALEKDSPEERMYLLEKATNKLEKANYESYIVGTICYTALPGVSGIKVFAKIDEEKEFVVHDGEQLDGLFNFLEDLSNHYKELVLKK